MTNCSHPQPDGSPARRPRRWKRWLCIAVVLLVVFAASFALISGNKGLQPLIRNDGFPQHGKNLFVLVHGYTSTVETVADVRDAIKEKRPDADVWVVDFPSQLFSNASPFKIADELSSQIQARFEESNPRYEHITLVGHSIGALLARKAYIYGLGHVEDLPNSPTPTRRAQQWTSNVDRLVLLAGMNRGWSLDPPPNNLSLPKSICWRFGIFISRITGTDYLMRNCERGQPFVANLRLQWMRAARASEIRPVIQLLGDVDDVVSSADNADLSVTSDFTFVPVHGTGHRSIIDFKAADYGKERKDKFSLAISNNPQEVEKLRRDYARKLEEPDPTVRHLVFIMHGIRDLGPWTSDFERPLKERFRALHPSGDQKLVIPPSTYEYFGMGPFLLRWQRQQYVQWFMDQYTEQLAMYPQADPDNGGIVDYIGHSNGTYILASALQQYPTLKVRRVVLAGSVVPQNYRWDDVAAKGQIKELLNYTASSDWVVAWFPRLFEQLSRSSDIGSGGFNGFQRLPNGSRQISWVPGWHFAALEKNNLASVCNFIMDGQSDPENYGFKVAQSKFVQFTSAFCIVIWLLIGGLLFLLGCGFTWISDRMLSKFESVRRLSIRTRKTYYVLAYLLLVYIGLNYI